MKHILVRYAGADRAEGTTRTREEACLRAMEARQKNIADGLAPPFAGERCFPLIRDHVEAINLVSEAELGHAIKTLLVRTKLLAEGAGAASLAGLLQGKLPLKPGSKVVCVLSGGNIDPERLKDVL